MSSHLPARRALTHPLLVLLSGHGGVAALTLMRNIIAARLIGVEEFGVAASFAIVLAAVEMVTALGAQQMIVSAPDGDTPEFQSSLHMVQLLRGLAGAGVIYLSADAVAAVLGLPDVAWAYQTLALVPLLSAFTHLDGWRYQRTHRFGPSVCIQIGPALLALVLIWPLYTKFGDFRVLLVTAVAQAAGVLVMSRLVSERRYLVAFTPAHLRRILRFGWPLALNGALLLAVFHGEKLLVAHLRGPADLAIVAMGFTLTLTPALILGRSLQSFALPQLVQRRNNPSEFSEAAGQILRMCLWVALLLGLALSCAAPLVPAVLGQGFAGVVDIIPILAALHAVRVVKTGVSVVALAAGTTLNAALGNLPRIIALPFIYQSLKMGGSLPDILWLATIAEVTGLLLALAAMHLQMRAPPKKRRAPRR